MAVGAAEVMDEVQEPVEYWPAGPWRVILPFVWLRFLWSFPWSSTFPLSQILAGRPLSPTFGAGRQTENGSLDRLNASVIKQKQYKKEPPYIAFF